MSDLVNVFELTLNYNRRIILDEISFNILPGQVIGLVGKNGAGKTTLLKILAGIIEYDFGEITYTNGIRIGYLPQEFELNNDETILKNIAESDYFANHKPTQEQEEEIKASLLELGIKDCSQLVKNLSGGQKKSSPDQSYC